MVLFSRQPPFPYGTSFRKEKMSAVQFCLNLSELSFPDFSTTQARVLHNGDIARTEEARVSQRAASLVLVRAPSQQHSDRPRGTIHIADVFFSQATDLCILSKFGLPFLDHRRPLILVVMRKEG
jgi:hypothetical protein